MTAVAIDDALRKGGHRVTAARRAVWHALVEAGQHLTAEEVAELATVRDPGINLASVYRSLTLFEELGLVRQSHLGDSASRWELDHHDEHFHIVCRICGDVEHHHGTLVQSIRDHLGGDGHNFAAEHVELTVTGVCANCR